jgi:hypothetical protein
VAGRASSFSVEFSRELSIVSAKKACLAVTATKPSLEHASGEVPVEGLRLPTSFAGREAWPLFVAVRAQFRA